jgi:hypothetical protein
MDIGWWRIARRCWMIRVWISLHRLGSISQNLHRLSAFGAKHIAARLMGQVGDFVPAMHAELLKFAFRFRH